MFKVRDKETDNVLTVYAVNGMLFLVYIDGVWTWEPMGKYQPA
jgi:hypothetical protein